jgi:L-lactate dehydrogenase complex protein LldF
VLVHLRSKVVDAHRGDRVPSREALAMKGAAVALSDARRWRFGERFTRVGLGTARRFGLSAWTDTRDLPAIPAQSFRDWWRAR